MMFGGFIRVLYNGPDTPEIAKELVISHDSAKAEIKKQTDKDLDLDQDQIYVLGIRGCWYHTKQTTLKDLTKDLKDMEELMKVNKEAIIIVGDPIGLEQYLVHDVYYIARYLGFPEKEALDLIKQEISSDTYTTRSFLHGDIKITVIWNPTSDDLAGYFSTHIPMIHAIEVYICYCGHSGEEPGSIELFDGHHLASDLYKNLLKTSFRHFPTGVHLLFNCCFAVDVCASFIRHENGLSEEEAVKKIRQTYNTTLYRKATKNSKPLELEGNVMDLETFNNCTKANFEDQRSQINLMWNKVKLYLYPLSDHELVNHGAFPEIFQVGKLDQILPNVQARRRSWETVEGCNNKFINTVNEEGEYTDDDTRIRIFQSKEGDSSLVESKGFAMLVDGGATFEPSFWSRVKCLQVLDMVLLTHGDCDHVNGLLPFIFKYKFPTHSAPDIKHIAIQSGDLNTESRGWIHAYQLAKYANEFLKSAIHYNKLVKGDKIYLDKDKKIIIEIILPTPEGRIKVEEETKKLSKEKKRSAKLTDINKTGIVFILFNTINNTKMLFTGDADGIDISEQIKGRNITFDYVDIPHHGSENNNPGSFLESINAKNLVISTNGSKHGHPSPKTLVALANYLEIKKETKLHFNYHPDNSKFQLEPMKALRELIVQFPDRVIFPDIGKNHIDVIVKSNK
ncbi:hypothetical protein PPL_07841 [Heterostelium album PN500]|uniref:Metallo-beta-lactamase domain-containing protein n=1 Tax=Heterostelium pallidum (strain ATCC 26659 / Pp 5 / PN500) TaxID=670386 RepID=D3BH39_HETP5|nr:hypothetical protein PPL_07841 [Heterostelium album PN500]EFA79423.1 hypothetical protein PPL_07841 [Heterostelium album PN500]|eukprot:XP_020431544.1 hypothetical protein PPL_07841 [Heterostelium album PN500]